MTLKTIAIALAAACAVPVHAQGPVDVAAITRQARADFLAQQHDQFAARTVNDGLAGREIIVTMIPEDGTKLGPLSGAFYAYEDGKLRLVLSTAVAGQGPRFMTIIKLNTVRKLGPPKVGANAYGARASFNKISADVSGLGLVPESGPRTFEFASQLDGPAAKRLALGSRFVVHAKVATLPNGHVGDCVNRFTEATIDRPVQLATLSCWVGAAIGRIDLVGPDGVLQTWDW